jgi:hypothetical protein
MFDTQQKICRIGQQDRCDKTGCEWRKCFGNSCSVVEKPEIKFVPAEDTKPFYTRRRKKGRVVKDEKKYTEIKKVVEPKPTLTTKPKIKELDFSKITIASQDDWLKKIKTI